MAQILRSVRLYCACFCYLSEADFVVKEKKIPQMLIMTCPRNGYESDSINFKAYVTIDSKIDLYRPTLS